MTPLPPRLRAVVAACALWACACGEATVDHHIARLADSDSKVRLDATVSLIELDAAAVMPLARAADAGSDSLRYIAAQILGRIGDRRATDFLQRWARPGDGGNAHVRRRAVAALAMLDDPAQRQLLENYLHRDPVAGVRAAAAAGLANVRRPGAAAPLVRALADSAAEVRIAALEGLNRVWLNELDVDRVRAGVDSVARHDPDETVRFVAVQVLGKHPLPDFDALVAALDDDSRWVRLEAIDALGAQGDRTVVAELERVLRSHSEPEQAAARRALRELTDTDYVLVP